MAMSRSTCASVILLMELLAFVSHLSVESAEKDTTSLLAYHFSSNTRVMVSKSVASIASFIALIAGLPPFFQAAAAGWSWRALTNLVLSTTTIYCATCEFSTNLLGTDLHLPHELVPLCLAALVMVFMKFDEKIWGPPSTNAAAADEVSELHEIKSS